MSFLLRRSSFCFSKALTAVTHAVSSRPANPEREWGYFSFCEIWIKYSYRWKQSVETSVFLQSLCFTERSRKLSPASRAPGLAQLWGLLSVCQVWAGWYRKMRGVPTFHVCFVDAYQKQLLPDGLCYHHNRVISPPQCPKLGMDTPSSRHGLTQSVLTALWQECQMRICQHPGNWCSCFPSWSFICSAEKCPFC